MRVRGRLVGTDQVVDVVTAGDRITGLEAPAGACDAGGSEAVLAPGWIDVQVNGYGGFDFNSGVWNDQPASVEAAMKIVRLLHRSGTTQLCPTLVTNSPERLTEGLRRIVEAREQDPVVERAVPGIHLEGPFISPDDGPRGAHSPEWIRDPDWELFSRLQEQAGGLIKILTIAPERPGAINLIEQAVAQGVVVSIGHSGASVQDVREAVAAGATMSTHLGNGSHAVLPRHPNYIWEQLAADELTAGVIADLQHLPASLLTCFARVKGAERFCAVSDCVALGGLPAGIYDNGRHEVLPSGRVNLAGTPYLAGAGHLLDTCLANLHRHTSLSEAEVVATATSTPARLLGIADEVGALGPGRRADLVAFTWPKADGPIEVQATILAGEKVYPA